MAASLLTTPSPTMRTDEATVCGLAHPDGPVAVRIVRDVAGFDSLAADWDRLAAANAFQRFSWARAWWDAYGSGRGLALIVAERAGEGILAIAPFAADHTLAEGRRWSLLGAGEACGDDLSILTKPTNAVRAGEIVGRFLGGPEGRRLWDTILLDGVSRDDQATAAMTRVLSEAGHGAISIEDTSRWAVALPQTEAEYVALLGARTRRLAKQVQKRWAAAGDSVRYRGPANDAELQPMLDALVELHGRRWRAVGLPGAFASPRFERLVRDAAERWMREGTLLLRLVEVDGVPAAGAIGALVDGLAQIYLLGRDPAFDRLQVGWMLNFRLLSELIDSGVRRADFLRGDESYKQHLGCAATPQHRVTIAGAGPWNRLRHGVRGVVQAVRAARVARRQAGRTEDEAPAGDAERA